VTRWLLSDSRSVVRGWSHRVDDQGAGTLHAGAKISPRQLPSGVLLVEGVTHEEHRNLQRVNGIEGENSVRPPPGVGGADDDAGCIGRWNGDRQRERRYPGTQHPAWQASEPQQQSQGLEIDHLAIAGAAGKQDRSHFVWSGCVGPSMVQPRPDCFGGHEVLTRFVLTRGQ